MNPAAPQLFEDVPQNLALDFHFGNTETVNSAFKTPTILVKPQSK
ncbi:MAG: hypothetical protein CM15mP62_22380 [Rhodospirillaceae bacterium]|nr:MAG: hypothetical protein CM15mP62_22380 [Rhodospirillaceae bacterium]